MDTRSWCRQRGLGESRAPRSRTAIALHVHFAGGIAPNHERNAEPFDGDGLRAETLRAEYRIPAAAHAFIDDAVFESRAAKAPAKHPAGRQCPQSVFMRAPFQ